MISRQKDQETLCAPASASTGQLSSATSLPVRLRNQAADPGQDRPASNGDRAEGNHFRPVEPPSSTGARPALGSAGRKVAIGFLAALIASTMIAWLSFLGWGAVAFARWFVD